ncbi:MAG: cation diffusion facilitator family transporter [Firmicutes bacterium]|nr:cation diffusion facilitator family transporter [Bacillota bacterium]
MAGIIVKKFIKDCENVQDPAVRGAYGKFSSVVGILCNAALFIGKIIAGTISGSVSITADAVNNLSDASSSVIGLLGFKLASRPADEEHPYGHGRYEYLAGLMVALLIMIIGVELFRSSLDKVINPSAVQFSAVTVCVLALSILLKLWMAFFNTRMGKKINSKTLIATAADSRNDVITTAAVLAAAVISHFTNLELDGWMGLLVALFILYSGFGLVKDTLDPLLGKAPDEKQVNEIKNKILSYPGVMGTHDLMMHDYGPGRQFASVHVEMAAEDDVMASHDVIDNIERDFLSNDGLHMIVHFDPISTADSEVNDLREWINHEIKNLDSRLTIHDLRIVRGPTHTNVIFDCVVPYAVEIGKKEIKNFISNVVAEKYPSYYCVITIDRSYAAMPH